MAEFELLGGDADDTRVLIDRAKGYSVAIPGHPTLTSPHDGGPRQDVVVMLRDLPVQLGFRIDELPTSLEPKALAAALVTAYLSSRAEKPPYVRPIGKHLRPASTLAGAAATYPLRDVAEPTIEQVWLLLHPAPRGVWALYHTASFRTAEVNTFQWGHLRAAIIAQHTWDRAQPREAVPEIWPPSAITKPSAKLDLTDEAWKVAEWKAHNAGSFAEDRVIWFGDLLREEVQSDFSPHTEVVEMRVDTIRGHFERGLTPAVAAVLLRDLDRCHTMHDLRGWAWQTAWAIGNRAEVRGRNN